MVHMARELLQRWGVGRMYVLGAALFTLVCGVFFWQRGGEYALPIPVAPSASSTPAQASSSIGGGGAATATPDTSLRAPRASGTSTPTTAPEHPEQPRAPQRPVASSPHDRKVGLAVGETLSVVSAEELARRFDDFAALGIGWVRADLAWSSVQREGPNTYHWEPFDRIVAEASERDIEVLPIITYTPRWARAGECVEATTCAPADPAEFAAFARAAVARYAPRGVHAWEVWNEPNLRLFFKPESDAERYTILLRHAYDAIKAADPSATVVSGGLAATATAQGNTEAREFLEQMYDHGAQGHFDALGFHPYSFPLSPTSYKKSNPWSQMDETAWSLRGILAREGDGSTPIWITEYGAPTGGPGEGASDDATFSWVIPDHVTEAYQAEILDTAVKAVQAYAWAGPLFWYSYRDLGTDEGTRENFFGILRADGSHKPAYDALRTATGAYRAR